MTEPCDLSATDARAAIGSKRLSPVELLESCISRIERVNPVLNAIVNPCFGRARREAAQAEAAVTNDSPLGKLHGLPLGVKDLNDVAGVKTTQGSFLFADHVPEQDDNIVAAMRAEGAVVVGKTNVPEHGFGATTDNPLFGPTGNPYDPALSAGASTGGGASALAARMVPLATGSDFAGSLRTPAAFCGIFGMRPSSGAVASLHRGFGWSPFDVEGPLARTAADAKLLMSAMTTGDRRDPLAQPVDPAFSDPVREVDLARLRVAVSEDLGFAPMSRKMREAFRRKIKLIEGSFALVEDAHPEMSDADRAFYILRGIGFVHDFRRIHETSPGKLGPAIVDELGRAGSLCVADIGWAMDAQTRIFRSAEEFFKDYDLLVTPAASVPPFRHAERYPAAIDGVDMGGYLRWEAISYGVTLFAGPAAAVPCGIGPGGLPAALQIVSRVRSDSWLLDVAHTLEKMFADDPELATPAPDLAAVENTA